MNNEPVAWMDEDENVVFEKCKVYPIPLYTHPAKTPTLILDGNRVYPAFKELTDEEINKLWAESHEDGIAMQQGFTTQQHYFAHLILRKASEK